MVEDNCGTFETSFRITENVARGKGDGMMNRAWGEGGWKGPKGSGRVWERMSGSQGVSFMSAGGARIPLRSSRGEATPRGATARRGQGRGTESLGGQGAGQKGSGGTTGSAGAPAPLSVLLPSQATF